MTDYAKNVVIAKFMGASTISEKTLNPLIRKWECIDFHLLNGRFISGHELKFDQDLYWILPVVQKLKLNIYITTPVLEIRNICFNEISKLNTISS